MGLLRGDGLHMDNNCTVKALNHSGFGSGLLAFYSGWMNFVFFHFHLMVIKFVKDT